MTKYRVARVSHIGGRVYQVGEEVEYDGHPSSNLEPINAEGERKREEAEEHFAEERDKRLLAGNPDAAAMGAFILRGASVKASARAPATKETHK